MDASKTPNESEETSSEQAIHPWPYLETFFKLKSCNGNTIKFMCLLCAPRNVECSAYANSPSNLRKHVEVGAF